MSGICDTCHRASCHARMDGMKSCGFYAGGESNYERLFGTPEKAARTLAGIVTADGCEDCALLDATCSRHEDVWLEWLRGDAE